MSAGDRHNFSGDFEVTAPTGGYSAGDLVQLNSGEYVVVREAIAATETGLAAAITDQPVEANKPTGTGESFSANGPVYVNGSNQADPNSTGNTFVVGVVAAEAAATTDATVKLRRGATAAS